MREEEHLLFMEPRNKSFASQPVELIYAKIIFRNVMLEVRAGTGGDEVCKEVNLTMSDHPTCLIITL